MEKTDDTKNINELNNGPEAGAATGGAEKGADGTGNGAKTLKDALAEHADWQSELDRRINSAVEKATASERERQKVIQDNLRDEVERVSRMTQEEKDAYFQAKAQKEQADKEADLLRRELSLDARLLLSEKGLPAEFVDLLNFKSKEDMTASVTTLEVEFSKAVQAGVEKRLAGGKAPEDAATEGAGGTKKDQKKEDVRAEMKKFAGLRY